MQSHSALFGIVALLTLYGAGAVLSRAERTAAAWVQEHPAPQGDELAELKGENPEAYALVKALLTKRSLGLLDPTHPTASFAAGPAPIHRESGAAAFAKLATPGELQGIPEGEAVAASQEQQQQQRQPAQNVLYSDVPAQPAHHDWMSWKPQQSAMDDDQMVKNVLGAVAELRGAKIPKRSSTEESPLASEEATFGSSSDAEAAPSAAAVAPAAVAVAAVPSVAEPSASAVSQAAPSSQGSGDFLASFSRDQEAQARAVREQAQPAQAAVAQAPVKKNALLAWLGGSSAQAKQAPPQASTQASPQAPQQAQNSYMAYFNN